MPRPLRLLRSSLVLLLGAAGAALGCRDGAQEAPPVRSLRLLEAGGTLLEPSPRPEHVLWSSDLAAGAGDWRVVTSQEQPRTADPDRLSVERGLEDPRPFLSLAGTGALCRFLPVEPQTTYAVRAELRLRGLVPGPQPGGAPFRGATLFVAELVGGTEREDQLLDQLAHFERRHVAPRDLAVAGWQPLEVLFRTGAETHALALVLLFTIDEPVVAGAADFASPRLVRVPEAQLWERMAAAEARAAWRYAGSEAAALAADDWRLRRAVSAMLAAEERPAILLLPGERLRLDLRVPGRAGAGVRFQAGLGPWPADYRSGPPDAFALAVDGREVLRADVARPAALVRAGWRELDTDLTPFAGRPVTLELIAEGAHPLLIGAPRLVASSPPPPASPTSSGGPRPTAPNGLNVVLISLDTLRADHVGAYGHGGDTTPNLDDLARESLVFEDALAQAPYTLPSHATLFSGQFPRVHGVQDRGFVLEPARSPILARLLAGNGYVTQAFTAAGFLLPDFGFHQGFDGFAIVDPLRHAQSKFFATLAWLLPDQVPADFTPRPLEAPLAFLERHAREPFFLFLHTYEVHEYDPPPGVLPCAAQGCPQPDVDVHDYLLNPRRRQAFPETVETRHLIHRYDAALRHVDELVGRFLERLDELGLAQRTVVVVTSDHGEELFDRGHLQHGKSLHEELLRIPLIVRVPGVAPRRVKTPAFLVDVAPTILGALGIRPDARMQGVDLLHDVPPRPAWAEVDDHYVRRATLRTPDGWKLIHGSQDPQLFFPAEREWRLYDLARDPGELRDLADAEPERLRRLRAGFEDQAAQLDHLRDALGQLGSGEVSEEAQRLLRQLGYTGE